MNSKVFLQEIETVNLECILYTDLTYGQYFFLQNFDPIHTNPRSESNCSFSPGTCQAIFSKLHLYM